MIADLFHRMKYMERRGSGLHKIVAETEKLPGYTEELRPQFISTDSTFKVILKNVNYNSEKAEENVGANSQNVGVNVGANDGVKLNKTQIKIIEIMRNNEHCTAEEIATVVGVEKRTIERNIKYLKEKGLIDRDGADKNGRWIVIM